MSVYLIKSDRFIKIGYSESPLSRAGNMQTGNPHELELMAVIPGDTGLESYLHERFAELRVRGEWFECTGLLEIFVNVCQSVFPVPEPAPPAPIRERDHANIEQHPREQRPRKRGRLTHDTVDMMESIFNQEITNLFVAGIDVDFGVYETGVTIFVPGANYRDGEVVMLVEDRLTRQQWERKERSQSERIAKLFMPISIYVGRMGGRCRVRNRENGFFLLIEHARLSNSNVITFAEMQETE